MTPEQIIKVVQAYNNGKKIQYKVKELGTKWIDCNEEPVWDFLRCDYKVKKEPRRFWININKTGFGTWVYSTKQIAEDSASENRIECIEVMEVLDES